MSGDAGVTYEWDRCDEPQPADWLEEQRRRGRSVRKCVACNHDHVDARGEHIEDENYWCYGCWGGESNRRNAETWIGKTIARVRLYDSNPGDDWTEHEVLHIEFTDGTSVEVSAWGHDAWGIAGIQAVDFARQDESQ